MLPCVCSVIEHIRRQNMVRTSVTHTRLTARVPLFCSYHILTSSVIYMRQHGIYLLICSNFSRTGLQIQPCLKLHYNNAEYSDNIGQGKKNWMKNSFQKTSPCRETYIWELTRLSRSGQIDSNKNWILTGHVTWYPSFWHTSTSSPSRGWEKHFPLYTSLSQRKITLTVLKFALAITCLSNPSKA